MRRMGARVLCVRACLPYPAPVCAVRACLPAVSCTCVCVRRGGACVCLHGACVCVCVLRANPHVRAPSQHKDNPSWFCPASGTGFGAAVGRISAKLPFSSDSPHAGSVTMSRFGKSVKLIFARGGFGYYMSGDLATAGMLNPEKVQWTVRGVMHGGSLLSSPCRPTCTWHLAPGACFCAPP
jgi:hypothetical protein